MSRHIPEALRREVRTRAGDRCEYCGIAQAGQEATFHIDHIQPRSRAGATTGENLALSCVSCSLRKGARSEGIDPDTGETVALFHPRRHQWAGHFRVGDGFAIVGLTATGRATLTLLQMNREIARLIRSEESARGRYPGPEGEA